MGSRNVSYRKPLGPLVHQRHYAVIGGDEYVLLCRDQQRPALAPHSRINDDQVNCIRREVRVCLCDGKRTVENVKRLNGVTNVDNLRGRINAQNHALHGAYKIVVNTEVCRKRDKPIGHVVSVSVEGMNATT